MPSRALLSYGTLALAVSAAPSSVTSFAGPMFESEARDALRHIVRDLCPWIGSSSDILTRTLDRDGDRRQADVFFYAQDSHPLMACAKVPMSGASVLTLDPSLAAAPPVAIGAQQSFSPYDSNRKGPHKYVFAEVYSGDKLERRIDKLLQLETLIDFSKVRWESRTARVVRDITSIIGAAGLIFSAGVAPRADVLAGACAMVQANAGAHVKRLMQAGRFFVMVLDKSQMPQTGFQRAVAELLIKQGRRLETIAEEVVDAIERRGRSV
jgi:hypothetical protein